MGAGNKSCPEGTSPIITTCKTNLPTNNPRLYVYCVSNNKEGPEALDTNCRQPLMDSCSRDRYKDKNGYNTCCGKDLYPNEDYNTNYFGLCMKM